MDMTDNELLQIRICPDCRNLMDSFFVNDDTPWCKECDIYFNRIGDTLCRNKGAAKEYKEIHESYKTRK